jgi:competence protein ComFA
VVLELLPRLERVFGGEGGVRVVGLHGAADDVYAQGELVVATTHQLLRFREAFELLVVDELDAFPFAGERMLTRAAARAVVGGAAAGRRLWLTATPSPWLRVRARLRLGLSYARVPVRFHGRPLPVPVIRHAAQLRELAAELLRQLSDKTRAAQAFVFVPFVRDVPDVVAQLQQLLPPAAGIRIAGTSSQDAERANHVLAFREHRLDVLVTTTILERGVTVPTVDVHVWQAAARVFNATSLVQIAGRAGRSEHDASRASVHFWADEPSLAMHFARRHIRATNRLARHRGYVVHP